MNTSDYRREFAASCAALERERYKHQAGLVSEPEYARVYDRFADLWSRPSIDDLERAWKETPSNFETERAALRALLGAAQINYVESQAAELTNELARCGSAARVRWDKESVASVDVPELMAAESDAGRRRELAARWFDAVRSCDDLRAELLESRRESARALGFDDERAMHEDITGAHLERLLRGTDAFLQRTAPAYYSRLSQWAARERVPLNMSDLHYADGLYFRRTASLDIFFPSRDLRATYTEASRSLGIRVEAQGGIRIDDEARPLKAARSACFVAVAPEEIYLVVGAREKGARLYRNFFAAAGEAQSFAWASRELAAHYPEFVHAPDGATRASFGLLFRGLFSDSAWLAERRGLRASEADAIAQASALVEMHDARLCCARLSYADALREHDARSEQLSEIYSTLHTEATGFRYDTATATLDASASQRAAEHLRARLFAAGLAEYLRGRYGRRWWSARKAGDELIDIWNTASRYPVEELARLVGIGEPDFDLLAGSFGASEGVQ